MVAVKTGLAPPPMMPNQPMNTLPSPMPVPMQFGQQPVGSLPAQAAGTAPVPVNARRRKRFGDSLETMLASRRPPVASDQMGDMNVFTGQMMNTAARPPVVGMRGGGIVRNMRRGGTSMADYSGPSFAAAQSAASQRNPGRTGAMTHSQLMDKIRGGSSPNDDKPAPVVTFPDDDDYTPTSAELAQQLSDQGLTDLRSDTSVVPDFDMIKSGSDIMNPDRRDAFNQEMVDRSARNAARNMRSFGGFDDVELPRGTGGLSSVPSVPSITYAPDPSINLQEASFTQPGTDSGMPNTSMQPGPAYSPSDMPNTGMTAGPAYLPLEAPLSAANINLPEDVANALSNLGLGDPNATGGGGGAGGGQGGTGTGTGSSDDEDDEALTFLQRLARDFKAIPGNIAYDMKMLGYAGLFGSYKTRLKNMMDNGVPEDIAKAWLDKSEETMKKMMEKQAQQSAQDDDGPMSTSPIDPCPPGSRLDPVAGICVPVEEEEDTEEDDTDEKEDTSDDELSGVVTTPPPPTSYLDNPIRMNRGGSVGLNRAADNFLAAMGA